MEYIELKIMFKNNYNINIKYKHNCFYMALFYNWLFI